MSKVKVLHLSDIHFSEKDFWKGLLEVEHIPHRHGHDPATLLALDRKLKEIDFDILIISGDLSRAGHLDSFAYAKNWIYKTIKTSGNGEIGLNLEKSGKKCYVIPGNHDCFNEKFRQLSL